MDCFKCVFSESITASGGPWGGPLLCSANRLETFKAKGKVEEPSYQLTQFCNMYREQDWAAVNKEKDLLKTAEKEVQCAFGIVIYHESGDNNDVYKTIQSIKEVDYDKDKLGIVLSVNQKNTPHVLPFVNMAQQMTQEDYYFRFTMHSYDDRPAFREWECFMKIARAGYITKIQSGQCIHPNTFNIIDEEVNVKLNQIALFDHEKNDVSIVNKYVASLNYLEHNNFDKMVNSVRKLAQEDNLYLKI